MRNTRTIPIQLKEEDALLATTEFWRIQYEESNVIGASGLPDLAMAYVHENHA
jgi:hypothetical protein